MCSEKVKIIRGRGRGTEVPVDDLGAGKREVWVIRRGRGFVFNLNTFSFAKIAW